jgi:uncharacterized protein
LIILDSSGLLAALHDRQRGHHKCVSALEQSEPPLILSPFVLAELDYMLGKRVGERARLTLLAEVDAGAYALATFSAADITAARAVIEHYADLRISLADASIVVLSERYGMNDVLTLDERHFRVLHGAHGLPFRVLPADL